MISKKVLLKVTGFSSATKLADDVGSCLVDVGYIETIGDGFALLAPDDPENIRLEVQTDFDWFRLVVIESLRQAGEQNVFGERYEQTN
jgi:hypothetical protein